MTYLNKEHKNILKEKKLGKNFERDHNEED
jgi:hypothetical protein